jgi:hypothetical protein
MQMTTQTTMRPNSWRVFVAAAAIVAGVLCNAEAWIAGQAHDYDLLALYIRWWIAAPILGICFSRDRLLAAACFVLPSSILRLSDFLRPEMLSTNLGPMVVMFDVAAGLIAAALVLVAGWLTSRVTGRRQ